MTRGFLVFICSCLGLGAVEKDADGFLLHWLESPYQAKETSLRVLMPDHIEEEKKYTVLYVLPVHEDGLRSHGDGLFEVRKLNVHNKHQLICVAPAFTSKPWFADHDKNPKKRDESHLLKTVLPFVETNYPARTDVEGRLLIGFSKSGWGAMTLLLRNPQVFHKAVGWDTGIRVDTGPFDEAFDRDERVARDFGSYKNFEKYRISTLVKTHGRGLGDEVRLFYFNRDGNVRAWGGAQIHNLLVEAGVPHRYVMEPYRDHRWDSGWIPEAVEFLVAK